MALIDKDQLKAEIKRIMSKAMDEKGQDICEYVLAFLDTLKETPTCVNRAEQRKKDQAAGKKIAVMEIRAEIERRRGNMPDYMNGREMKYKGQNYFEACGRESAYDAILNIIDTVSEQEPKLVEWSEKDEINIKKLDGLLSEAFCYGHVQISQKEKENLQRWLKSLCPHWKPSEEQMDALREASVSWMNEKMENAKILESLYEQLKKL